MCLPQWRRWIRPLVFTLYIGLVLTALPLCVIELNKKGSPASVKAWFIAGLFVMVTLPVSLWAILAHLINYTNPGLQRYIIRILWMVPIYSLNAWFALRFPKQSIYLDTMRECYEAYVIHNFMMYLLCYLRSSYPDLEFMLEQRDPVKHLFPICCMPPWPMGRPFLDRCKHGVLQYSVIRPITTVITLICELLGVYGEGDFLRFDSAFPYILFVNNMSQVWAMYCLILFYKCCRRELSPMRPVSKFLCVKFVVFLSFWQSIAIAILAASGVIGRVEAWKLEDPKSVARALQDFAICVEMFLAALAHYFSFSHKPYVDPGAPSQNCCRSFLSMWDVSDVGQDFVEHINHVSNSVRSTLPSRRSGASGGGDGASPRRSERRPLLEAAGEDFEPAGGASSGASSAEAGMLAAVPIDPCVEAAEADFDAEACSDAGTHRGGKWVVNA
ncbi:hypothetical protein BOX15_Mlig005766g1 [Macrostomum lignano]|uniref:Transmembrane protein 184C n=1 Tax=Macrostomum lignano TaxID=282301 RepID=A0A267DIS8_9PLAT|nr:hypothetical protein BOX15_Mlig005766g1 [Macrostomum lignano]